jgi:predicted ATPase/DNA-binding SARP family transcriptional activator
MASDEPIEVCATSNGMPKTLVEKQLIVYLFGQPRFALEERSFAFSARPKTLPLLCYLLLHRERPLSRAALAFSLWPDEEEEKARANLRRHLRYLVQALPAGPEPWVVTSGQNVAWNPRAELSLDVAEFDLSIASGDPARAVELYRGDLLEDSYEECLLDARDRLRSAYLAALTDLVLTRRAARDFRSATAYARRLLQADPWREDIVRELMAVRYAGGDAAGALAEFDRFARLLRGEINAEPMPETIALRETVMRNAAASQNDAVSATATDAALTDYRPAHVQADRTAALPLDGRGAATNLPVARMSLIGRELEIAEIVRVLGESRLVTVTGAGGVGKTRTALAVGDALVEGTKGGVWFIELAPLAHGSLLASAVARVFNVRESPNRPLLEALLVYLKGNSPLLILDNCEQVIEDAAALADALLRECPQVRILATSREPLRIAGEQTFRLPSLGFPTRPDAVRLSASQAADYAAVALFVQRAQAIDRGFVLSDDNAPIVGEICRQLDGIPLAVELAAARVNILPLRALSAKLDQRFRILAGGARTAAPRHQTMRALIDWSYELLDEDERALLRRVSVFVNGFTLRGAVAVHADLDDLEVFDVLASLIDKSLVTAEPNGDAVRYRLLESTRIYGLEKLQAADEHRASIRRHLRYVRDVFCEARQRVDRSGRTSELDELLAAELEDVRIALDCIDESTELKIGAELLAAIDCRWDWINLTTEGAVRLERFVASTPADERGLIARLWTALAGTVNNNGVKAREATSMALDLAREAGDPRTLADALRMHGELLARSRPTLNDGLAVLAEAESLRPVGNLWLDLRIRRSRAQAMYWLGDLDAAAQAHRTLREAHVQLRNADEANVSAFVLAKIEHQRKQTESAIALLREVLPALRTSRLRRFHFHAFADLCGYLLAFDRLSEARALVQELLTASDYDGIEEAPEAVVHAALVVALHGDFRSGALLLGYAELAFNRLYMCRFDPSKTTRERLGALLHERLAPGELRALRAIGAALSLEGAVALVRASLDDSYAAATIFR